jgi:hypothetical protein
MKMHNKLLMMISVKVFHSLVPIEAGANAPAIDVYLEIGHARGPKRRVKAMLQNHDSTTAQSTKKLN